MEGAVDLLYQVKQACERNPMLHQDACGVYFMVIYNLIRFLGRLDRFEDAMQIAEQYVGQAYQADMGLEFMPMWYLIVWNREKLMTERGMEKEIIKKACYPEFREVLLTAEAARQNIVIEIAKKYCEEYEKKE